MSVEMLECKEVKTNKDHRCEWCPEVIEKGERARYRKYVFEGRFMRGYMHPECYEAMLKRPEDYFNDEGFMPGGYFRGSVQER